MKILYKFPSRERPKKFFDIVSQIQKKSVTKDYLIHATLDLDDLTMNNNDVIKILDEAPNLEYIFGTSKGKIDAVNRDMDKIIYDWQVVCVVSDDMWPEPRFDEKIVAAFEKFGLDSVIHFEDGNSYKDKLMTLNLQGRDNYNRFGYLYSPEYISLWCDNEQKSVGEIIGNYHYMGNGNIAFKHIHPCHVKGLESDDLLRKTESYYKIDEKTYNERKARNFDL